MSSFCLEAVIWDMDGVIADTADYHYTAWRDIFAEHGVQFTREDFMQFFGRRHDTIIRFGLGEVSPEQFEAITERKQRLYRKIVSENVVALPGAIELIRSLNKHHIKIAIASSAPMDNITVITDPLGITDCFQAIVSGLEVPESKPDPAIFLLAAERLGARPENCVVMEDAVAGVAGAKKAGMKCVAVTNSHPAASLGDADIIVDSLTEISIERLQGLFG